MKKLLFIIASWLCFLWVSFADMIMTLKPWWNVVSTPAILSWLSFSNQWEWISFSKLSNWTWISVPATVENIKPLEWFMVYSSNANNVTMILNYKTDVTPAEAILQRSLNVWWNFLWIVTTDSPFNNIWTPATMSVDFTDDGATNNLNKVNSNYAFNSTSSRIITPQLWEAYWIFVNQENALYWWINGGWTIWGWSNWWSGEGWNTSCVGTGSLTIPASAVDNTALLKASNTVIAQFTVKPSSGCVGEFDNIVITGAQFSSGSFRVKVDGIEYVDPTCDGTWCKYRIKETVPTEWVAVRIVAKTTMTWDVEVIVASVNDKAFNKSYSKYFVESLVRFTEQDEGSASTVYALGVNHSNDVYSISWFAVTFSSWNTCNGATLTLGDVTNGQTFTVYRWAKPQIICGVDYYVYDGSTEKQHVTISKSAYKAYFKVDGKELAVPAA